MNSFFKFINQLILIRRSLMFCLVFFLTGFLNAQELPPIKNYNPSDYGGGNQNWAIDQGGDHHVYFGNNEGLLEYDGARWTRYASPNGTIIRAVKVVDDLIYTGCYMEFGYWKRNALGSLEYFSLSDDLDEPLLEDEHFWNIVTLDEWILFQSKDRIYIYDAVRRTFKKIDFAVQRAKVFPVENKIFVQKNTGALHRIQNGKTELESDHPVFLENFIVGIYQHQEKKVIITENGRIFYFENGQVVEWETELMAYKDLYIYSSIQLKDGSFILGTISNGYFHISDSGRIIVRVNKVAGLMNNTVLSLFQDKDLNLWLGLDNGLSTVNLDSPFKIYKDTKGELGVIYASIVHKGLLYLGTNQGLFYSKLNSGDQFKLVKGTKGQVWSLDLIDDSLFCSHNEGTFIVKASEVQHVFSKTGTWGVKRIIDHDDLLLQGNYNGLNVLRKERGGWKFRNKIKGLDISSRAMVVSAEREIIMNHEYKGLFLLLLNDDFTRVDSINLLKPKGFDSSVLVFDNKILYTSSQGVFEFNRESSEFYKNDFWTSAFYTEGNSIKGKPVFETKNRGLWAFSDRNIIQMSSDSFDGMPRKLEVPIPSFFRRNQGLKGYENITYIRDETYLIGSSDGYVLLDVKKARQNDFQVKINAIKKETVNESSVRVSLLDDLEVSYEENSLSFAYSVPEYNDFTEVEYQYRLEGLKDDWSSWSTKPDMSFKNLASGAYVFHVRARMGNKFSENIDTYSFEVSRPWYFSNLFILIYVILFFMFMGVIHKMYKTYYSRQKLKIHEENDRRMELARLEDQQEIMKLKNKQLSLDLESKNRELATTAMSLINKNELLQGIKNDLLHLEDSASRKEVARVIDKNLSSSNDWAFFKEAFDNADKDFLHKIKSLHPDLTANDLKFCAFLRLNLSSKEIAPLLNISVRSVEIKRYRLRKKLKLEHSDNLVDYILEI